jgi:hypothetical protein
MSKVYQFVTNLHGNTGNYFANVFHYNLSEAGSGVTPFQYADALISAWITHNEAKYMALFGNDVILDFYSAKRVSAPGGPSAARAANQTGTGATNSISTGACADVQWQTAAANNRPGHTYIGGFPSGALLGDVFQAGYLNTAGIWITSMEGNLTLSGALGSADFGTFTRKTATFNSLSSGSVRPKATMMNRRLLPQI